PWLDRGPDVGGGGFLGSGAGPPPSKRAKKRQGATQEPGCKFLCWCKTETKNSPPMTVHFVFTTQAFLRDPAARLERLRAFGPVVEVRFPIIIGKTWITTTQEAA